jgi:hypothetical protein
MFPSFFLGHDAQKLRREIPETDQVCVSAGLQLCLGKGEISNIYASRYSVTYSS